MDGCNCFFGKCSNYSEQPYCPNVIQETNSLPFLLPFYASCLSCALLNAHGHLQCALLWGCKLLTGSCCRITQEIKVPSAASPNCLDTAFFLNTAKLLLHSGPYTYFLLNPDGIAVPLEMPAKKICSRGMFFYAQN